jgi:hypothetical protein
MPQPSYVVWATPAHPSSPWAVGHEIRPGCLKVVAYAESKPLADALAKRLGDGLIHGAHGHEAKTAFDQVDPGDADQGTALRYAGRVGSRKGQGD